MRTLYLHIGAHRTATSSIQSFLHLNLEALLDRGVFYPFGVKRHLKQANAVFSGDTTAAALAETLVKRAESKNKPIDTVILSDEDICMRPDLSVFKGLSSQFDVKVVYSLRRQDLWLESWYLQNVKWQWNPDLSHLTFDAFMARKDEFFWVDYDRYLTHLEAVFGRENIVLGIFEKGQMKGGPVADFCRLTGISDMSGLTEPPHINSSHGALMSEVMRCLPLDEAAPSFRATLEKALQAVDGKLRTTPEEQSTLLLTHGERLALLAEFQAGNARVAQRYFGRDQLFFDPPPGPDAVIGNLDLPETGREMMDRIMAPMIWELIQIQKAQPQVKPGPPGKNKGRKQA
jgi:hypothetical protein